MKVNVLILNWQAKVAELRDYDQPLAWVKTTTRLHTNNAPNLCETKNLSIDVTCLMLLVFQTFFITSISV